MCQVGSKEGSKENIGWRMEWNWNQRSDRDNEFEYYFDAGKGHVILLDDQVLYETLSAQSRNKVQFKTVKGHHTLKVYAAEDCCDGWT